MLATREPLDDRRAALQTEVAIRVIGAVAITWKRPRPTTKPNNAFFSGHNNEKEATHIFSRASIKSLLIGLLSLLGENPLLIPIGLLALLGGLLPLLAPGPSPIGVLALDPAVLAGLLADRKSVV